MNPDRVSIARILCNDVAETARHPVNAPDEDCDEFIPFTGYDVHLVDQPMVARATMQETFFATRFAQLRDRFGINWMIVHERQVTMLSRA